LPARAIYQSNPQRTVENDGTARIAASPAQARQFSRDAEARKIIRNQFRCPRTDSALSFFIVIN